VRVLLVEDSAALEMRLREAFAEIEGVEVVYAAVSEPDAARWLSEHPTHWDLAVVDIFLRDGHGFDVLRECAGRGLGRRVVVLSNYTRDPVRASARALGADAVFDKSFELDGFMAYCADFARSLRTGGGVGSQSFDRG
jgi:DNA-binding NarL/FixJ family response regulator